MNSRLRGCLVITLLKHWPLHPPGHKTESATGGGCCYIYNFFIIPHNFSQEDPFLMFFTSTTVTNTGTLTLADWNDGRPLSRGLAYDVGLSMQYISLRTPESDLVTILGPNTHGKPMLGSLHFSTVLP